MYCSNCGNQINGDSNFCSFCGVPIPQTKITTDKRQLPLEKSIEQQLVDDQANSVENFSPSLRYFTAVAGTGIVLSTFLPWIKITQGDAVIDIVTGITTFSGMIAFFLGGTIIVLSFFMKETVKRKAAYIAGLIALISFFPLCILSFITIGQFEEFCFQDFFGPNNVCKNPSFAAGILFLFVSISLTVLIGIIADIQLRRGKKENG